MIKLSAFFAGTLVAATAMVVDWAMAAPLGHSMSIRPDQMAPVIEQDERGYETPAHLKRQVVAYHGGEAPGTVIIDTPNTYLYLVIGHGRAIRYGIGVGRDGFRWSGVHSISKKAEWPDWTPPAEMIARQPYLPRFMAGGATNPLGARAMYLGSTIYRIHGTNAPSTIGQRVSSGCIRLTNEDVADLYSRVNVGTKVVVLNGERRATAPPAQRPLISAPVSLQPSRLY
jgi:lipoprotein-anchoring transpeptidase ErfK/SrfK